MKYNLACLLGSKIGDLGEHPGLDLPGTKKGAVVEALWLCLQEAKEVTWGSPGLCSQEATWLAWDLANRKRSGCGTRADRLG
jgi:hypothetical protein